MGVTADPYKHQGKPVRKAALKKAAIKNPDPNPDLVPTRATNLKCGAQKRDGTRCGNPAGKGTNHLGVGRCHRHGGSSPSHNKAAEKEVVRRRMALSSTFGDAVDIGPHEALLEEVQRTAGHVYWLGDKVKSLETDGLTQYTAKDGIKPSEWIAMYQEERKMLVAVCNTAIRAGIAERQVRIVEEQGKIMAMAFMRLINSEALALNPEQRLVAPSLVRALLLELPQLSHIDPNAKTQKVQVGEAILDVEVVE